ncbi:MAG: hypothetical protein AAB337_02000 [Patescibacteria group bacterium]
MPHPASSCPSSSATSRLTNHPFRERLAVVLQLQINHRLFDGMNTVEFQKRVHTLIHMSGWHIFMTNGSIAVFNRIMATARLLAAIESWKFQSECKRNTALGGRVKRFLNGEITPESMLDDEAVKEMVRKTMSDDNLQHASTLSASGVGQMHHASSPANRSNGMSSSNVVRLR